MTSRLLSFVLALVVGAFASGVSAQDRGSREEAQEMATRAAELLRSQGPEAAFAAFNAPGGQFHDRDLYVFVFDSNGVAVAHGGNPALVGTNMMDRQDPAGVAYVREFLNVEDEGWVDYQFMDPQTNSVQPKTSYIVRVDDYAVGVGAYRS